MEENKIRVAITHGDTNGTGYETIFKTFADPTILELCTPIIYGSPKIAAYHRKSLGIQANFTIISKAQDAQHGKVNMLTSFDEEVKVDLGTPTKVSEKAARMALQRAINDQREGLYDVLVTLPVAEANAADDTQPVLTQPAMIAKQSGNELKALVVHVHDGLRVASVTDKMPLANALSQISKELVAEKAVTFFNSLKRDFRLPTPRLAILQVNPQCGEEEKTILQPVIEELQEKGIGVYGPYSSEEYFNNGYYNQFDGTLAMYYNQAMTPFRLMAGAHEVMLTTGLPVVHTTPGGTPDYEKAGQGMADESPLREAIYLAIDTLRNRTSYDEPLANPLKKLYHEKRDESEKVRFAIPKKRDEVQ